MKQSESGFLMIEGMVALFIVALVLMALTPNRRLNNDSRYAVAIADAFERADVMAAAWSVKHIGEMMTVGPTIQDMDASAVALDVGVTGYDTSHLPRGMTLRIRATLSPVGCVGVACSVEWLAYSSGGTGYSAGLTAQILRALGARGAASTPESPSILSSWHARWTVANPVGAVANTIATRGAYSQTNVAQSIRVDGTSELVADWNVGQDTTAVAAGIGDKVSLGVAVAAPPGGACAIANATALGADGITPLACVGGVWVVTHAPTKTVVGTTTTVGM